ncbi:bifunctional pyrimidine biosynthesis protein [Salix suchowensis]|nr:bifunctional pyrimidine biosynthesis protein [Salix suchowensis]
MSTTAATLGTVSAQGGMTICQVTSAAIWATIRCWFARPLAPSLHLPHQPHPAFHRRHILSSSRHSRPLLLGSRNAATSRTEWYFGYFEGKVLCTLFYEPSTRTSSSFDAAMKRCGGEVVQINAELSSVQKGETLPDTVRTLGCYGDAIVLRHPDVGSAQIAAKFSPCPSSTQALLDVYTIRSELGTVNGRTITLLGDLKNGRTVHSLVSLLCLYSRCAESGVVVYQCESLDEVLADTDVLYVTRVQKERFESEREWQQVKDAYRVDHAVLSRAKEDMIVMHPLPRVNEIDPEVDFDSRRAVYFRQMRYGLYVRSPC